jgi:hypothetical protein
MGGEFWRGGGPSVEFDGPPMRGLLEGPPAVTQAIRYPGIQASRQRVSESASQPVSQSASQPVSQSASWAEGARAASRVRKLGLRRQTDRVFQNSDSSRPTLALVLGWGDLSHQFIGWGAKVCGHQAGETASPCGLWRGGEKAKASQSSL